MIRQLVQTQGNSTYNILTLLLRLALGLVILPHGAQKLLGWFGGYGYKGMMDYFVQTMRLLYVFGLLAIIAVPLGCDEIRYTA